jgi:hypothetical protein
MISLYVAINIIVSTTLNEDFLCFKLAIASFHIPEKFIIHHVFARSIVWSDILIESQLIADIVFRLLYSQPSKYVVKCRPFARQRPRNKIITSQRPAKSNKGMVFSVRSVLRYYKYDKSKVSQSVGELVNQIENC